MVFDPTRFPRVLTLYLELGNYPILAERIRERMRQELFRRRVITPQAFEEEVRQKAIQSQYREGLRDPLAEEPPDTWAKRLNIVRDHLTDFYFAYNLPHDLFESLVREALSQRLPDQEIVLTFHPELAPWDMLFAQGAAYEALPPAERRKVEHHLKEIKVVLIKAMISDHLDYVGIAKEWFDIADLRAIRQQRFGRGRIGGKAAGVMLAECILRKSAPPELLERIRIPRSWFLGADVFYQFTHMNDMLDFSNQKYRSEDEIREAYPSIRRRFRAGQFPADIIESLRSILAEVGNTPLIVRSSSLLEDSFGTSFAGKYESHFCPNQGGPEENLEALLQAIADVYSSVYSPDAILYRRQMKLLDYDERMAILIQEVQGQTHGRYFFPEAAGVAFSRNQFRWNPRIDRYEGFARLVWGLGTRAVERLAGDYPRLVALSHPDLRPESSARRIQRYSQHYIDLIDLEQNTFATLPVEKVIRLSLPYLRYIAQELRQEYLQDLISTPFALDTEKLVITFQGLLMRTDFPQILRRMLDLLEQAYERPVDTEIVVQLDEENGQGVRPMIHLVQCRPQSRMQAESIELPRDIPKERIIFRTHGPLSDGRVNGLEYLVYVQPQAYRALEAGRKHELARLIGRINTRLAGKAFMLLGPGRWGSVNPDLGIPVTYADIYNTRALVEIVSDGTLIEPSYGTHFFQDLVEARIAILALHMEHPETEVNRRLLDETPNAFSHLLPAEGSWGEVVRLIHLPHVTGQLAELIMDSESEIALAYLAEGPKWSARR